jgi:hypothetical protein
LPLTGSKKVLPRYSVTGGGSGNAQAPSFPLARIAAGQQKNEKLGPPKKSAALLF